MTQAGFVQSEQAIPDELPPSGTQGLIFDSTDGGKTKRITSDGTLIDLESVGSSTAIPAGTTFPTTGYGAGDVFFNTSLGVLGRHNGGTAGDETDWDFVTLDTILGGPLTVANGGTGVSSLIGDRMLKSTTTGDAVEPFGGTGYIYITDGVPSVTTDAGGEGTPISYGTSFPTSGSAGDMFFNTILGVLGCHNGGTAGDNTDWDYVTLDTISDGPLTIAQGGTGVSSLTGDRMLKSTTTGDAVEPLNGTGFVSLDSGVPAVAALEATDIPPLDTAKITTGHFGVARGGTGVSSLTGDRVLKSTNAGDAIEPLDGTGYVYLTDGVPSLTSGTDGSGSGGVAASSGNMLINGCFRVAQRGTTVDVYNYTYTLDRWYVLGDGDNIEVIQTTGNTLPSAGRIHNNKSWSRRLGLAQIVESKNIQRGQNLTLSANIKVSEAATIRLALLSWDGTIDSPIKEIVGNWTSTSYTIGGFFVNDSALHIEGITSVACDGSTWATLSLTTAAPLSTSTNNLIVFLWTEEKISASATVDIEAVQLETGETATPFQHRSIDMELSLCKRYYQRYQPGSDKLMCFMIYGGAGTLGHFPLEQELRAAPVCVFSSQSNWYVRYLVSDYYTNEAVTWIYTDDETPKGVELNTDASVPQGSMGFLRAGDDSAWVGFSAEL
jgi:hypothetical protein